MKHCKWWDCNGILPIYQLVQDFATIHRMFSFGFQCPSRGLEADAQRRRQRRDVSCPVARDESTAASVAARLSGACVVFSVDNSTMYWMIFPAIIGYKASIYFDDFPSYKINLYLESFLRDFGRGFMGQPAKSWENGRILMTHWISRNI